MVAPYFCFVLISRVAVGLSVICTELLDLQFRGGGSSCKFGGDDEEKKSILLQSLQHISTLLLEFSLNFGGDGYAPTVIFRSAAPLHGHHWLSQK